MQKTALNLTASFFTTVIFTTSSAFSGGSLDRNIPPLITITAGPFVAGSDASEREAAYVLDEQAYGHSVTRNGGWYDRERTRTSLTTKAYQITKTAISNEQYAAFIADSLTAAPNVDRKTWASYGLVHPYSRTRRYAWGNQMFPKNRDHHPVVMVSHKNAVAYAGWLSQKTGQKWALPTEMEWEKAARGTDGRWFPWGNDFDADKLNSNDKGPFDTTPVGSFENGASPFGLLDGAGQVYEWTADQAGPGRYIVKGGSWDDKGCGVCRPAARHSRPENLKHILVGFRLVVRP